MRTVLLIVSLPMIILGARDPMFSSDLVFLRAAPSTSRLLGCLRSSVELVLLSLARGI